MPGSVAHWDAKVHKLSEATKRLRLFTKEKRKKFVTYAKKQYLCTQIANNRYKLIHG